MYFNKIYDLLEKSVNSKFKSYTAFVTLDAHNAYDFTITIFSFFLEIKN